MTELRSQLVVVGGGMVAHRLVEALRDRDSAGRWQITVLAEEPRAPYDRVALTTYFSGRDPDDLALGDPALWSDPRVTLRRGEPVTGIDRVGRTVRTSTGRVVPYDALVLATGSSPFVPPVPGHDLPGCFVYRTVDDVAELRAYVGQRDRRLRRPVRGAVVGGGLLGLEAAGALQALGVTTTVVEFAPRLMSLQVDDGGGEALRRLIEGLGVTVRTGTATTKITASRSGRVARMTFADQDRADVDVVVFATGVRPRDELARATGLPVGERGGVIVDDACRTDDPAVWAIGEVACVGGRCLGLVAPGYAMAEVVADRLVGGQATFPGADTSAKLKLLGVDVASFGDAFAQSEGSLPVVYADPVAGVYKKLVLSDDARTLRGGILVGDASAYSSLRALLDRDLGADPAAYLLPDGGVPLAGDLPDDAAVCSCHNVSAATIRLAVRGPRRREGVYEGRHRMRVMPATGEAVGVQRTGSCRRHRQQCPVRALRPHPRTAFRRRPGDRAAFVHRHREPARARTRLRRMQAGRRVHPRQPGHGSRPRRRASHASGHERPRAGEHPERRHLLRGAAGSRRRDHA
jgi:nitrite reductase (NADH) large subunit